MQNNVERKLVPMTEATHAPMQPLNREVGRDLPDDALPAYAPMLAAYHRAHAAELRHYIEALPLQPGDTVLDMACGDGTYALWLAEQVGHSGTVIGVDIAPVYLDIARQQADRSPYAAALHFELGSIDQLALTDGLFDLAWCGQSLSSLPDPLTTLRTLRRVVRPGGTVAVLENDPLHQMIIPWPPDLELTIRQAQLQSMEATEDSTEKFAIGRQLGAAFQAAGLVPWHTRAYTTTRHAPLSSDEQTYLAWYFQDVKARVWPAIEPHDRARFDQLLNPESADCLFHRPGFFVTYIDLVTCGTRADESETRSAQQPANIAG
jgi:demethylmenaquinone methyltransferase/2-methoxy-6-polyprenyl-1,4-benzoquinol methylase